MSNVFLVHDLKHHRDVALKVLRPELAVSVAAERFLREIEIGASLQHPHILPLFESGEAAGLLYYSMPYVEGETLREKLRRETQLALNDALSIAEQVSDAVAFAHNHNVVHRDIKPENILLTDGHATVADFGVARAISEAGGEELTGSGIAVGTPTYMSPEQALASADIDQRSDVYSLGLVVYEMLAGEPPFTGPTPVAVLARHANEKVPPLEVLRPNVPSGVVVVIEKALEKVPADRYQTASAFAHALKEGVTSEVRLVRIGTRRRRWAFAVAVPILLVVLLLAWWVGLGTSGTTNPDWVIVYPLEVSGTVDLADVGLGEDNAYLIWNALDGRSSLKWINALDLVDDPAELRLLSSSRRRSIARAAAAGFYLTGRAWREGNSWRTYLTLHETTGDSVVARADTVGPHGEARLLGVRAVGQLLLRFLPEETVDVSAIAGRKAEAVQAFVQAERHFHAGRFVNAFDYYSAAVNMDSGFALAAVKGAQAASWSHEVETATDLVTVALRHSESLTQKHQHFARGIEAFLAAKADTAVYHFEQALVIDREWTEAWTGLGEVYMHLLPRNAPQDSLAEDAFRRVYENTSGSAPALFHLIEFAIRDRDLPRASRLLEQYRAASPDTTGYAVKKLELMMSCADVGPDDMDWHEHAIRDVESVAQAARSLGVGGAHARCSLEAWRAVREHAPDTNPWRFAAWMGFQSLLVATGQDAELSALLDTTTEFGGTTKLVAITDALVGATVNHQAEAVAAELRGTLFDMNDFRHWFLGVWAAYRGRLDEARTIRDSLTARAARTGNRRTTLVARSMGAHAALVEGDTALAIALLNALAPTADRASLQHPWEALALERLVLARTLVARGRHDEAHLVARTFDSPGATNIINTAFLPASLRIRIAAAEGMGEPRKADEYRRRLAVLQPG